MRLNYKVCEIETVQYVDVMSLYPYIFNYFEIPVCLSFIHVADACKDKEAYSRMDALIKCSIVAPERYHPVLLFRATQKLMFCVCRTCVLTSNTGECSHTTDEQRSLTVTCLIYDVRLVVQNGYMIS